MPYAKVRYMSSLKGSPKDYFEVVSDMANWFMWNENILHASLDGPFEEGARGVAIPALFRVTPLRISKVEENKLIQLDFMIPLGKIRARYQFLPTADGRTEVHVSTEIRSFYGWVLYLLKSKKYRDNLAKTLAKLEVRLGQLK